MERRPYDRRRRPDVLAKWVRVSGGISWFLVILALVTAIFAKPRMDTIFDQHNNIRVPHNWDTQVLQTAFIILIALFIFCVISLIFNSMRMKRKTDRFNRSIIFNAVASLFGILMFLIFIL
ncbi:MAG: hypothetical protein ACOZCL_15435 [Bacillota bacterium]